MNDPAPQLFTAAQLALALGRKRQAIARALESVPPSGERIVAGNIAHAWTFDALPARLQNELTECATRRGFRNADALINGGVSLFASAFEEKLRACPLSEIRAPFISRALKLRDALAAPLARQHEISGVELTALGLAEFSRVFGFSISAKHWNRIFDRTAQRDGNACKWLCVELYLDDAAFVRPIAAVATIARHYDHAALNEVIAHVENKTQPTSEDRAWIFNAAFHHFESHCATAKRASEHAEIKASLVAHLFSAVPGLAKTLKALRRNFDRKHQQWIDGGRVSQTLADERHSKSGNFRFHVCAACERKLVTMAVQLGGNESQAYRRLRQAGQLCDACTGQHTFDVRRNKSAVPASLRERITPVVDSLAPLHRGEWEARMRGPYIPRDWSGVAPADWFSGDDVTWNNYFYHYDEDGQLHIERGECLLITDLRTGYPLDFILIAGKYNSRHIRSLITKIHDRVGLPHNGFYFEQGVWASRLIDGDTRHANHWRETEDGLRTRGLDLQPRHATTPRAKPIEGLLRILQERQRCEPGFVGFNERTENMERMQEFIARARHGKEHPANELLEMDQWVGRIRDTLNEFKNDPQNGKMLDGATPAEMWKEGLQRRPVRQLPAEARYLLATHKKPVRVHQHGIKIKIGKETMLFANEHTGKLIGQEVLAFYNVDFPELLTVSDLNRENYFSVKRLLLPAMSATRDQFAEVNAAIKGHMRHARTVYGNMDHEVVATITRDNSHTEQEKELGLFHNKEEAAAKEEKSTRTRKLRKIQAAAGVNGATVGAHVRNPDRVLQGIELEQQMRARLAAKQDGVNGSAEVAAPRAAKPAAPSLATNGGKKVYTLNSAPACTASVEQLRRTYWSVWNRFEKSETGADRHGLTRKALGYIKRVNDMSAEELNKAIAVFTAAARAAKEENAHV
jgi:hypothetical protein